ncbi:uncharacterized protein LOC116770663 isoform X2 [Danaus plexippus]|uniref:Odorant-binding protein 4 n=2 Tax=Danaus plexippus TaxID=13037 RepID=A0A212EMX4_DANPL|nr:uncharacterized protein LOC116770663 isoform X2 [Danaus plexippus]XP_061376889.1 uncharacterized protein LOC116770663 isoform X2 [Danaus plexippus]OWR42852.1 odorant-binding protein 4 [Danaus plexippus plexippus]
MKKWFLELTVECSKEHPVTKEEIQMLKDHKIPDNKNVKCLMGCVFRKIGWLDDNGMFSFNNAYKTSEEEYPDDKTKLEKAKNLYSLCEKVNTAEVSDGKEGCERSSLLAKCLIENSSKMGFVVQ